MDNVCHSLAGAAIAQAGFARRLPRATILAVIAANIPDVDALAYLGSDAAFAVSFRRGVTHGLPALVAWSLLLALAFAWIAKRWPRETVEARTQAPQVREYLVLAAIAVVSHPSLDWLNNYGVRFLAPFSDRWFYGDTLSIVDPVMIITLGVGWAFSRFMLARRSPRSFLPARVAVAVAVVYVAWMKSMSEITRSAAAEAFALSDPSPRELMVVPPRRYRYLDRRVKVSDGQTVTDSHWRVTGFSATRDTDLEAQERTGADSAVVSAVLATRAGARFLLWSRFPYFIPDPSGGSVFVGDMRYSSGDTESWAGIRVNTGAAENPTAR